MISVEEAIKIHAVLIEDFGGSEGIRDSKALESALLRPYQTFDNKELYLTPAEKAAALVESLITNHPFLDGNKRTGYVAMRLTLLSYGLDISASEDDKFNFVMDIASGKIKYNEILNWIKAKMKN